MNMKSTKFFLIAIFVAIIGYVSFAQDKTGAVTPEQRIDCEQGTGSFKKQIAWIDI